MPKLTSPLDRVRIAAPCTADWDKMFSFEDERVRFCSQCNLNVYNLSAMSKQEAEALVTRTEGRLCVRFYRRSDGSILTRNCPIGLKAIKRRVVWVAQVVIGMALGFVSGFGLHIFHWGKKTYPLLDNRSINAPKIVSVGVLALDPTSKLHPRPAKHQQGEVILESRKSHRTTYKIKSKGRNQASQND